MDKQAMIAALSLCGTYLQQHASDEKSEDSYLADLNTEFYDAFEEVIKLEYTFNAWFTEASIRQAIAALANTLNTEKLEKWLAAYPKLPVSDKKQKTVGVIMAGNIPLVGFHDFLSVLLSGHKFLGKPSSKDEHLIKEVAKVICAIEPAFSEKITFTDAYLKEADAIIATGSNNSAKYFDYYFKNHPHIIRKNRSGVAVLSGMESDETLRKLGHDIFSYYGLGCRNVTKIFIPESFKIECLLRELESYTSLAEHNKYMNNITYHRTMYLMNKQAFLDNGVVLVKESESISSPVGVVFYEKYSELNDVISILEAQADQIQCVISEIQELQGSIAPGKGQEPELWDYADNVDTMQFLTDLSK